MLDKQFHFHHLGVAVADLEKSIPIYRDLFGYELISGPFNDPLQKVVVCFLSRGNGDMTIELVMPSTPNSPVMQTLKQGGSAYHVCYEVPNIGDALKHLKTHNCGVFSNPFPAVAFGGRLIAWLSTPTRQLIELVESA